MKFGANKTPIEVFRKVSFGGTYFREFILVLMRNGTKMHGNNLFS